MGEGWEFFVWLIMRWLVPLWRTAVMYLIEKHLSCLTARFHWKPNDPEIVSDVLFAIANVISFARTTYLMPAFEVLGPLQISLGRMIGDITRFMVLFTLVCILRKQWFVCHKNYRCFQKLKLNLTSKWSLT